MSCLYMCACFPFHHQTMRSRDRSMSCREGGRCKTRPGRMIPNQGKRMKEQGHDAKLQPLQPPVTGISAWFISPELCWGGTIIVIMMNRAIWMQLPSCVICELCATYRLTSSQNDPARTQLGPWSSFGALPPSHEALHVQNTWWSVFNRVWWPVIGSFVFVFRRRLQMWLNWFTDSQADLNTWRLQLLNLPNLSLSLFSFSCR